MTELRRRHPVLVIRTWHSKLVTRQGHYAVVVWVRSGTSAEMIVP